MPQLAKRGKADKGKRIPKDADLTLAVRAIFSSCSKTTATHRRLCNELEKVRCAYQAIGMPAQFMVAIIKVLRCAIACQQNQGKAFDRVVKFIQAYGQTEARSEFCHGILKGVKKYLEAEDRVVRRNATDIVATCMMILNQHQTEEEADEDQDWLDELVPVAHDRMDDKVTMVRLKAIDVVYLLQEKDKCTSKTEQQDQCDITQHLMQLISEDLQPVVRSQCLHRIETGRHSIHCYLQCIRDSAYGVRRVAFKSLQRVPPRTLRIQQRVELVQRGLNDRTQIIQMLTKQLLNIWLQRKELKDEPVKLLDMLDIESNEKLSEQVAVVLYEMRYKKPDLRVTAANTTGSPKSPRGEGKEPEPPRQMTEEEWDVRESARFYPPEPDAKDLKSGKAKKMEMAAEAGLLLRVVTEKLAADEPDSGRVERYLPDMQDTVQRLFRCICAITSGAAQDGRVQKTPEDYGFKDMNHASTLAEQMLKLCLLYEMDHHTEEQRHNMEQILFTYCSITQIDNPTRFVNEALSLFRAFYRDRESEFLDLITTIIAKLRNYMSTNKKERTVDDDDEDEDAFFDAEANSRLDMENQEEANKLKQECQKLKTQIMKARRGAGNMKEVQKLESELDKVEQEKSELEQRIATDAALWIRSLEIVLNVLEHIPRGGALQEDHCQVALSAAQSHQNSFIRAKALRVLAIYCVANKKVAPTYSHVFLSCLQKTKFPSSDQAADVMEEALHGLFDIFLEHGLTGFCQRDLEAVQARKSRAETQPTNINQELAGEADEEEDPEDDVDLEAPAKRISGVLFRFLCNGDYGWDGEDQDYPGELPDHIIQRRRRLQAIAVCGFTKLLSCNRCVKGEEAQIVAQLLLFFFNPAHAGVRQKALDQDQEQQEQNIHEAADPATAAMQALALFFPQYAFSAPSRQTFIKNGALISLRHFVREEFTMVRDPDIRVIEPPAEAIGKKRRGPQGGGTQIAGMIGNYLSFVTYLTDAKELKQMRGMLREMDLLQEEEEDAMTQKKVDADKSAVPGVPAKGSKVRAPKMRTAAQQDVLTKLASHSLHEGFAYRCLLEAVCELNWGKGGTEKAKPFIRALFSTRFYNFTDLSLVKKCMLLVDQLGELIADKWSKMYLSKFTEAATKHINECNATYGSEEEKKKKVIFTLSSDEKDVVDKEIEVHRESWKLYCDDMFDGRGGRDSVAMIQMKGSQSKRKHSQITPDRRRGDARDNDFDFSDDGDFGGGGGAAKRIRGRQADAGVADDDDESSDFVPKAAKRRKAAAAAGDPDVIFGDPDDFSFPGSKPGSKTARWQRGAEAEALFMGQWHPCTVGKQASNGTYTVEWEAEEAEMRGVKETSIRARRGSAPQRQEEDGTPGSTGRKRGRPSASSIKSGGSAGGQKSVTFGGAADAASTESYELDVGKAKVSGKGSPRTTPKGRPVKGRRSTPKPAGAAEEEEESD